MYHSPLPLSKKVNFGHCSRLWLYLDWLLSQTISLDCEDVIGLDRSTVSNGIL